MFGVILITIFVNVRSILLASKVIMFKVRSIKGLVAN